MTRRDAKAMLEINGCHPTAVHGTSFGAMDPRPKKRLHDSRRSICMAARSANLSTAACGIT
jgi:hypothetical protein